MTYCDLKNKCTFKYIQLKSTAYGYLRTALCNKHTQMQYKITKPAELKHTPTDYRHKKRRVIG